MNVIILKSIFDNKGYTAAWNIIEFGQIKVWTKV